MNPPLKPCRKCGSPAMVTDIGHNLLGDEVWQIFCPNDACRCKPINYRAGNPQSRAWAVRTWNERHSVGEETCQK